MKIRTRFAPSPTGYLHIGGARTALFSWLYSKKMAGEFVLRIEDTDRERSTQEAVDAILEGMNWLGLSHDEGPVYQTERYDRYNEVIKKLLDQGDAYFCNCSRERLDEMREQQMANKQKPKYDGCCREKGLSEADDTVVRFKNPLEGEVEINDHVRGKVVISNQELDDLIIQRSDGNPTYNLTVVVDDMDMEISHVIRGDDHLNNTPRQINILNALGAVTPEYAHVPMINGTDGKKLSKRRDAVSVMQYRDDGYLKEAVINYLVRLGWSHGDQEVFSLEEMIELFDIDDINKSSSSLSIEKLQWLNQHYMKQMTPEKLAEELQFYIKQANLDVSSGPDLVEVMKVYQERCSTLVELVEDIRYFYEDITEYNPKQAKKQFKPAAAEVLLSLKDSYEALEDWHAESIHQVVESTVEKLEIGFGKVGQPLRLAVTGHGRSPSIDVTLELLGKEETLSRLDKAIEFIKV
ncbi:MAG: glutamate--tRNA ligase [endosymbiont of Galathealinum brachiosum]|uniref:Glutamate--tRNA ligase n=1 Tax=endosymbiont of Galathealinum brachiosum TaxID=2200906 RepID=A0A370D8J8_9GAMM|nr:MAG: glutamate--tRNA ligase [endosymbiont of Galathealinum brachiosum]